MLITMETFSTRGKSVCVCVGGGGGGGSQTHCQAWKYFKIGTCSVSQKLLACMGKMLMYIGNHPNFHLPCSLRHSYIQEDKWILEPLWICQYESCLYNCSVLLVQELHITADASANQ